MVTLNSVIILIIVFSTSIWVYLDASKLDTKKFKGLNGPVGFCICSLLLWIIAFPYYLVKRKTIINGTAVLKPGVLDTDKGLSQNIGLMPASPSHQKGLLILLWILPAVVILLAVFNSPGLPGCAAAETKQLVTKIIVNTVRNNGLDVNASNIELNYISLVDKSSLGTLTCSCQVTISLGGEKEEQFITYSVSKDENRAGGFIVLIHG
jgi:hypothetical protein